MTQNSMTLGELARYLAAEIKTQINHEAELREALLRAIAHMKSHASQTGSMHGWWDVIGELERIANRSKL